MRSSPSIRSSSRVRTRQRGFVLAAALIIAVLYLALIELLLLDSTRSFKEAQQFRSHVIASTLAESGAELAALHMTTSGSAAAGATDDQGTMNGKYSQSGNSFTLTGDGATAGVPPMKATVLLEGTIDYTVSPPKISIAWSRHSQ